MTDISNGLIVYFSTTETSAVATTYGYSSATFKCTASGEWVTYVIDLTILPNNAYKANADGEYVLDTFYLLKNPTSGSTANDNIDIAYMAFAEDWKAIDSVVDEETVIQMTVYNGSSGNKTVYTATGEEVAQ